MCRAELPPGPEKLYDEAIRRYFQVTIQIQRRKGSWAKLSKAQYREMRTVLDHLRNAAAQGFAKSQDALGYLYSQGHGITQSHSESIKWLEKAAAQRLASAQHKLGVAYENGRGVVQDFEQAARWYQKAADQGDASALLNLGFLFERGQGVPQDDKQAFLCYKKSASGGNLKAQSNLGVMYANGKGVEPSLTEAAAWFRRAADQGHANARCHLAMFYEKGLGGLKKKQARAIELYQLAAGQGVEPARQKLAELRSEQKALGNFKVSSTSLDELEGNGLTDDNEYGVEQPDDWATGAPSNPSHGLRATTGESAASKRRKSQSKKKGSRK